MKKLIESLETAKQVLQPVFSEASMKTFMEQQEVLKQMVLEYEHIKVPIVGAYSSGKRT